MKTIGLLSGPNLEMLGQRRPEIYGTGTLDDHVELARATALDQGYSLDHLQSNHEGELVDTLNQNRTKWEGLVINAGALTHYGWSLHDSLAAFERPVVELHLSNPYQREAWRHVSVVAPVAVGVVAGFGGSGYRWAIEALVEVLQRSVGDA